MSNELKPLRESLINFLQALGVQVRATLSVGIAEDDTARGGECPVDPDFDGSLHNDPMVTKNPASRYGDRTPGYITGNGLGSMEIGAADD